MRSLVVVAITLVVSAPFACSRSLSEENCDHFLGRGVGLAAYAASGEVPVDVAALKQRARGEAKAKVDAYLRACVGAPAGEQPTCARRANDSNEFVACGEMTKRAREVGDVLKWTLARSHTADECAKYAEHGVAIGVASVDDVRHLIADCDRVMEEGVYRCHVEAKDAKAWDACEP